MLTTKKVLAGTHRVSPPEETLSRLEPLLPQMGITRLADVTWLDDIGIPVYQAIRPNARTLSVSQGKGVSPALAKVSAAMEAIEGWHAERPAPGAHTATVAEMADELGYRIDELVLARRNHLNDAVRLEWSVAQRLGDGGFSYVPTDTVRLDARVRTGWAPRLFDTSSNGLASGNTLEEAVLHGLYEVVERDAIARDGTPRHLDLATVSGAAEWVLAQLTTAGVRVLAELLPSPTGITCFRARIWGDAFPIVFEGSGCHLDSDVALCRALTEAAQSRVTTIAGTRDDIAPARYHRARSAPADGPRADLSSSGGDGPIRFPDVISVRHARLADDLRLVVDRMSRQTGRQPLVVDHTRPELGVPVVHVICPGMRFGEAPG